MARGFLRPVDGSIPVQALLYNDEESLASQDSVGIYYGCVNHTVKYSRLVFHLLSETVLKNLLNIKMERSMSLPTVFSTLTLNEWRPIHFKWIFR